MTTKKCEPLLWLSDARGIYIPRDFATSFVDRAKHVSGVSDEDWETLESGPDSEWYWEAWASVCDNAVVTDDNGQKFFIWQEGDCWLIPDGMSWDDSEGCWTWDEEVAS